MPIFVYRCPQGHQFETLVMKPSDVPAVCIVPVKFDEAHPQAGYDRCGQTLEKVVTAPGAFIGADSWRR